jgi:hypothetical protein
MSVSASVASARANQASSASVTPAAVQAACALDLEQPRVLEERQPAGAEVVEQRPERLRADRDLRVQRVPAFQVEAGRPCGRHGQ